LRPPTPQKKRSNPWYAPGDVADVPTIDTNHAISTGSGWKEGAGGEWDGLDDMISGVQAGTAENAEDDEVGDPSGIPCELTPNRYLKKKTPSTLRERMR
jgi:hypothetical protein